MVHPCLGLGLRLGLVLGTPGSWSGIGLELHNLVLGFDL